MTKIGPRARKLAAAVGPSTAEDYTIINDLLETVERNPGSVDARWVLAEQYDAFGWVDAAGDIVEEILTLRPDDLVAKAWLEKHDRPLATAKSAAYTMTQPVEDNLDLTAPELLPGDLRELEDDYKSLLLDAQRLLLEVQAFQDMCGPEVNIVGQAADLKAVAEGRMTSAVRARPSPAVRTIALSIKEDAGPRRVDLACNDLEANARWVRSQAPGTNADRIRDAVRKRAEALKAALPGELCHAIDDAWMHTEHEILGRTYQNGRQTMLGDLITAIPRASFYVTEDGYAWDMAELASAIKANGGVMRNPLSKQMFSADDVRAFIRHPLGKGLAALRLKQKELTSGVRRTTVVKVAEMAAVLLDDQTADAAASREAVEDFLVYTATLPQTEQDALKDLRVPAKDSHTGQAFDVTIGDAVEDAKANRQCFHKTGDLLKQAAKWLANQKAGAQMPGAWS
ncbi:hypothetical protein DOTSEDRAFT_181064 [Dothistroma septosporum NZE10]|uniref:Uncharacterized protein n=1 Tax=Dothistroma septosporum (strain NZE10 / CBS 128990) TaxID=675120 RepID=M2Y111_DOTSN|nr:hypothetical protein DOTSEDRAFT_181064 [Dothistroma septosporum NZE10]